MDSRRPLLPFSPVHLIAIGCLTVALMLSSALLSIVEAAAPDVFTRAEPSDMRSTLLLYHWCKATPSDEVGWCDGY